MSVETMTKTEALAKALRGEVLEDVGYRGIIYLADRHEYVRYHITSGVHVVTKIGRTWKAIKPIMPPEEIPSFLKEAGVESAPLLINPLEALADLLRLQVFQRFQSGGGILHYPESNVHLRVSPISGVDFVFRALSKWRIRKKVWTRTQMYEVLYNTREVMLTGDLEKDLQTITPKGG